jgi:AraC-like DNA-binding protein
VSALDTPIMSELQRSEFLYAHREQSTVGWHLQAHTHSHHELIVVVRGCERAAYLGEVRQARTAEVLFLPAGQSHEQWAIGKLTLVRLVVGFSWSGYRPTMPVQLSDRDGRLRRLAAWLHLERRSAFSSARAFRNSVLRALLSEYLRLSEQRGWGAARGPTESPIVESVQDFVHTRLAEPFTLDDLARHVGLSKYYLVRSYRSLTGLTPMDHARLIRLEAARHLLVTTSLPLKTIAPRVGFASEYHLSRLLRSRLGVGARELRRQALVPSAEATCPQ